jgi:hypothetical protein
MNTLIACGDEYSSFHRTLLKLMMQDSAEACSATRSGSFPYVVAVYGDCHPTSPDLRRYFKTSQTPTNFPVLSKLDFFRMGGI